MNQILWAAQRLLAEQKDGRLCRALLPREWSLVLGYARGLCKQEQRFRASARNALIAALLLLGFLGGMFEWMHTSPPATAQDMSFRLMLVGVGGVPGILAVAALAFISWSRLSAYIESLSSERACVMHGFCMDYEDALYLLSGFHRGSVAHFGPEQLRWFAEQVLVKKAARMITVKGSGWNESFKSAHRVLSRFHLAAANPQRYIANARRLLAEAEA